MIRDDVRDNGEFQLTRAQEIQRQREGYLAVELEDVERFRFRHAGRSGQERERSYGFDRFDGFVRFGRFVNQRNLSN